MAMDEGIITNLILSDYKEKGLYLLFKDSTRLILTKSNIEKTAAEYWSNPSKIPQAVKQTVEFQRCSFCPLKNRDDFCDALRPILPFLDVVDKYVSIDEVTAIYKGEEKELLRVSYTTMQEALKYLSILSLPQYCQIGRKYWKYFYGAIPLMNPKEIAGRGYLNAYWLHDGNRDKIINTFETFREDITATSQNQVKRLSLICKNDAFLNAFVNTQVITEFLNMDIEKITKESFEKFESEIYK